MTDTMFFIALPYLSIFVCVVGSIMRMRSLPMTYSSISSQFLESKSLVWGSVPWHIGIISIVVAHLLAFLCPGFWQMLVAQTTILHTIEAIGLAFAICCLVGLVVLAVRRITSDRVQAVTSPVDLLVLCLLIVQVILGIAIAVMHKWGAAWAVGTAVPYLWSLLFLHPDLAYIADLPVLVKTHLVFAWLLIFLVPFSRLIHMFAVPLQYLTRPPQNVIWNNARRSEAAVEQMVTEEARRDFLKGGVGITAGTLLLTAGAVDKVFAFFFGPRLSKSEEETLMAEKIKRLESTTEQRRLELERQSSKFILVAALRDLSKTEGKYFIDYQMNPAMAFAGDDGLPILISAKCTHLGCTIGNEVNNEGKVLCPCHVSYFDIKTGFPNADAPAKAPLPFLCWSIMDKRGNIIASKDAKGQVTGDTSLNAVKDCNVYVCKSEEVKV